MARSVDQKQTQKANPLSRGGEALAQKVLGDPTSYPDEFKSWIVKWLYGNLNFKVVATQLPTVETHHLVGASGEVAFGGTWANFGGSNEPARYWKDYSQIVRLGGIVNAGVIGTTIFTLPAGYRPQYALIFAVASNGALGILTINPDGTVVASSGSNVYFSLSGISFRQFS